MGVHMKKSEYHRYLASREWALLKNRVKERSKGKCERCLVGNHAATHHLTYERIGHERLEDLQGVCEECHKYLSGEGSVDPARNIAIQLDRGFQVFQFFFTNTQVLLSVLEFIGEHETAEKILRFSDSYEEEFAPVFERLYPFVAKYLEHYREALEYLDGNE